MTRRVVHPQLMSRARLIAELEHHRRLVWLLLESERPAGATAIPPDPDAARHRAELIDALDGR